MRRKSLLLLLALTLSALPAAAASQEATLTGRVSDRNGQPLPGATLALANDTLAFQERVMLSGPDGTYRFAHLPPGTGYRLTVSMPGFATLIFSDIDLDPGRIHEQNIQLPPSSQLKEVVKVTGKSETLDTEKVTASTTFTSSFIADLPILGRDYQDILVLAPGVTDINKTGNPNIHGARDTDVITLVDGVSTTDPFTGYFGQNLNIESIQELEVITSAATAQYSRAQGGFASILTKSGSNEFQGTFKFYARSDRLDGDGAGVEKPELSGGLQGDKSYTEQHFTDLMPFLSLSGAMVRDKLWYYASFEYIHEETPVNALSQAFVTPVYGNRAFAKTTWQMHPSHRLAFSLILDKTREENLGIGSLTDVGSGFSNSRGGPTLTLRESAIFKPTVLLESTLSWFDNRFAQMPTTNPDTNRNGLLFVDDRPDLGGNGNGILEASERDPGEDYDFDGDYDLNEDLNHNLSPNDGEDLDGDGRFNVTLPTTAFSQLLASCEGYHHEDLNCNGTLEREMDTNLNGVVDSWEDIGIPCEPSRVGCVDGVLPDTAGNHRFDSEDRNGNGQLDVVGDSGYTPFPFWEDANGNFRPDPGEFRSPLPPDQDLLTDRQERTYGPSPYEYHDHRQRASWLEDLSLYVADLGGTHDIKLGMAYEHEGYDSDTTRRPMYFYPTSGFVPLHSPTNKSFNGSWVFASLGVPAVVNNTATGSNLGLYLQDTWKPIPNLTLGLGLRFDFESVDSFGYSHFDPAVERKRYDDLMSLTGIDTRSDGIVPPSLGLCLDPIHSCVGSTDIPLLALYSEIRNLALTQMSRHNLDVNVTFAGGSGALGGGSDPIAGATRRRRPEDFEISNANLAPRLSLSWDPWADGKTMAFGSWGRYYDKLFLNTATLEQGPDTVSRSYAFDVDGVDGHAAPNNRLGAIISQSALSAFQVDRSLATPYADEWTAGFRRELAPEVLVSFRYVHRNYHDQLQDIDVNHRTITDPSTGKPFDLFGDPQCSVSALCYAPDGAPDLYIQNFNFNRVYRLGNTNEQTYRGFEIEFVRRLKRKWQMESSYTYSKAQGDAEAFLSYLGNDPGLIEYESGYLDYDQRHVIKFSATAFLPGDWRLGGTATWASGMPYSAIAHFRNRDDVGFIQSRILFGHLGAGGWGITREMRNVHRNEATYLFNARLVKSFVIGKASASAFLEVYNLLNSDTMRVYAIDQIPAQALYDTATKPPRIVPAVINIEGERDFGRRFQVGFQMDF